MDGLEQQLFDFMIKNGVVTGEARKAAEACGQLVRSQATKGAMVGLLVGGRTLNLAMVLMGLASGAGFGAAALMGSPSCAEVREAAYRMARI
jgi:hypothetical protein